MSQINLGKERRDGEVVFRLTVPRLLEAKVEDHLKSLAALLEGAAFEDVRDEVDLPPGVILRNARRANSMTQKQMAEVLGVKQTQISEMESGVRRIPENIALKIWERFGIESSRLINQ